MENNSGLRYPSNSLAIESKDDKEARKPLMHEDHKGEFSHAIQFWLSWLGSAVGYGNIWRFPYVLFNNGGGAFFIPYFVCIILIILPLYYLEWAYGQLFKKALHRYYDSINPKFLGLSAAISTVCFFTSIFLTTLLAWCINFLILSFQDPLPWDAQNEGPGVFWKEGYFKNELLHISEGIEDMNYIVFWIAFSFLISWVVNYMVIYKSLVSIGYAVYVLIPLPYFLLFVLFIRGVTLEGFYNGWIYLFEPDWSKIFTFKIWKDAGAQVIFSWSLGVNIMMLFSSNRGKDEKIFKASLGIPLMNFATSIFAWMALFSFLGYVSQRSGVPISEMPIEGSELAFVVYPALITTLPFPQFWSVLFFIMLIWLGLSSQFPYYEVWISFLHGMFSRSHKLHKVGKTTISICFCILVWIIDILFLASDAGFYWFTLLDHFAAGLNLLVLILVQTIFLGWFLDLDQIETRIIIKGETIPWIYKISIKYISPAFITFLIILGFIDEVKNPLEMPFWAQSLGYILLFLPPWLILGFLIFR